MKPRHTAIALAVLASTQAFADPEGDPVYFLPPVTVTGTSPPPVVPIVVDATSIYDLNIVATWQSQWLNLTGGHAAQIATDVRCQATSTGAPQIFSNDSLARRTLGAQTVWNSIMGLSPIYQSMVILFVGDTIVFPVRFADGGFEQWTVKRLYVDAGVPLQSSASRTVQGPKAGSLVLGTGSWFSSPTGCVPPLSVSMAPPPAPPPPPPPPAAPAPAWVDPCTITGTCGGGGGG